MRRVILRGKCEGGLYPLISSVSSSWSNKQANIVTKLSTSRWHSHLGHPSSVIVRYVLSKNKLSYENSVESVCDPCQQAKSHQLPYPHRPKIPYIHTKHNQISNVLSKLMKTRLNQPSLTDN